MPVLCNIVHLFWALIFGVTIDGRYYAIKCSSDRGIEFKNVELEDGEK